MKKKVLNTVVIGLGRIAWDLHLPELLSQPDKFKVTAVVDPLKERGEDTREKFGVPCWYPSVTELIRTEKADLAVVCSPTIFHAEQTVALLNAGINVLCDKPAALNLEAAPDRKYPGEEIRYIDEIFKTPPSIPSQRVYYDNMYDLITRKDNVRPLVSPEETLNVMEILVQCRESAKIDQKE